MPTGEELEIPLPSMSPSYRVPPRRAPAMDPATRRLAAFAGVIGGALLLLVGVWSFTGHRHTGVPVIEADSRPVRVKPAKPGGLQVDGADEAALSGGSETKETAAPPPETPAPRVLRAAEQAAAPRPAAAAPPPPAAIVPETVPAVAAPAAPPPAAQVATAAPSAAPSTVRAELQPLPPLRPHITIVPPKAAPVAPTVTASATPTVAARTTPSAVAAVGTPLVQLAAVQSEQAALSEWQRLSRKFPDLLGGRHPTVMKTEHGGKTFWRLRTGGFGDVAQAAVFCERVKAKGSGCSIATF